MSPRPVALYYSILKYSDANRQLIDRYFEVIELPDPRSDDAALLARTEVLFAPLGFVVDAAKLDACPRLRAVVSNTTGIPHIDAEAAAQRGVAVCALHDEQAFLDTITATAEHTIGLMLAALRRIPACHAEAVAGAWDRRNWGAPRMLSRMRLGLVGMGRLGRMVARTAGAMGMKVAFFDPFAAESMGTLEDLAARSDVLSLHAVANAETRGLVSRKILETLPAGAVVVNTARGELLDTDALLDLLESGHLWAAALDTIDGEYEPDFAAGFGESRIVRYARTHDNLVLTQHIGGSTRDAWHETEQRVVRKAADVLGLPSVVEARE